MKLEKALGDRKNLKNISIATPDLNGVLRGKKLPISQLNKVETGNFRMPLSVQNLDIWGRDIESSNWVFKTGDADGRCHWTGYQPILVSWLKNPTALVPVSLYLENGKPFLGDPRHFLESVEKIISNKKLTCVVGAEIEFYLIKENKNLDLSSKENAYSISEIDGYEDFFNQISKVCSEHDIKIESTVSECGPGQFEIVLKHQNNILKVADDIVFIKYIIKGIADKLGLKASFMSKPFGDKAGSGLHSHISLLNENKKNIFDNGKPDGSEILKSSIAGLIKTMPELSLITAPHLNSYRRLTMDSHAPNAISWGYENRTVAIRIPGGDFKSRRIEHRVAGSDVNPYLYLSGIVLGIMEGIENKLTPPAPIEGNGYASDSEILPSSWQSSINMFRKGEFVKEKFPSELREMFLDCKIQEYNTLATKVTIDEISAYLETV